MNLATGRRGVGAPGRAGIAIALLAMASSAIGVVNFFTYDDRYIIELNPFSHGLHQWWRVFASSYWPKDWGGDGYRPLTILMFKLESAIGHGIPLPFHVANILLYAAVSVMVLWLARQLLPGWAAWVAAALFAVHPVHVEAVGNVVGQSELLVALFTIPAIVIYIRDRQRGALRTRTAFAVIALYLGACFSKENGVVLPAILGLAELTVIAERRPWRERVAALRPFYLAMTAFALAYIGIRAHVLSDHDLSGFQPFMPFATLHTTAFQRVLTAIGVVPEWVRLFYWPAHLSSEYGPPEIDIAQGVSITQLPGLLLLVGILALAVMLHRRRPAISFGIGVICAALLPASNFILPAGIVLAERTLFLPSVGAMLALGGVLVAVRERLIATNRFDVRVVRAAQLALVAAIVAGGVRSTLRTRVWYNNETLFNHAVQDSPRSYRAHYMLAAWDFEQKRKRLGEQEYRKAIALFPLDPFLSYNLAEQYRQVGACEPAIPLYQFAQKIQPTFPLGHTALAVCLLNVGRYDDAKAASWDVIKAGGSVKAAESIRHLADSSKAAEARGGAEHKGIANNGVANRPLTLVGVPSKVPQTVQKAVSNPSNSGQR